MIRNRHAKGPPGLPGSAGESGDTGEAGEARRVPCVEAALRISDIKPWIYGRNTFNTRIPFGIL